MPVVDYEFMAVIIACVLVWGYWMVYSWIKKAMDVDGEARQWGAENLERFRQHAVAARALHERKHSVCAYCGRRFEGNEYSNCVSCGAGKHVRK